MRGVRSCWSCVSDPRPPRCGLPSGRSRGGWDGMGHASRRSEVLRSLELQGVGEGMRCLEGARARVTSPARRLFPQRLRPLGWRLYRRQGTAPKFP